MDLEKNITYPYPCQKLESFSCGDCPLPYGENNCKKAMGKRLVHFMHKQTFEGIGEQFVTCCYMPPQNKANIYTLDVSIVGQYCAECTAHTDYYDALAKYQGVLLVCLDDNCAHETLAQDSDGGYYDDRIEWTCEKCLKRSQFQRNGV